MKRVLEPEDVVKLVGILDEAGSKVFAEEKASELMNQAIEALGGADLADQALENLKNLGQRVLEGGV